MSDESLGELVEHGQTSGLSGHVVGAPPRCEIHHRHHGTLDDRGSVGRIAERDPQGGAVGVHADGATLRVTFGDAPDGAPVVEGPVVSVMDLATGRGADDVTGEPAGLAVLDELAQRLV